MLASNFGCGGLTKLARSLFWTLQSSNKSECPYIMSMKVWAKDDLQETKVLVQNGASSEACNGDTTKMHGGLLKPATFETNFQEKAWEKVLQATGGRKFVNGKSGGGPVAALSTLLLPSSATCESESKTFKVVNFVVERESKTFLKVNFVFESESKTLKVVNIVNESESKTFKVVNLFLKVKVKLSFWSILLLTRESEKVEESL